MSDETRGRGFAETAPAFQRGGVHEVQASVAKTHFSQLLDEVERGETLVITRHGKAIARIVPEADGRQQKIDRVIAEIDEFRKTMPRIPLADLLSARHEGHKY